MRLVLTALCLFLPLSAKASVPARPSIQGSIELERVMTVLKEDMGMPLIEADDELITGGIASSLLASPFSRYYNARYGQIIDERALERATSSGTVCGGRLTGNYGMTPKCLASWIRRGQP